MQNVTGDDRLYRLFFESSSDALYVMPTSDDGVAQPFIEVNHRACEMLGYSRDQLRRLTLRDIDQDITDEAWQRTKARIWQDGHDRFNRQHTRSDGSTFPVEISVQLFHHEGQAFILAVARDITEQVAAQTRLKRSQQDLQALVDTGLGFSALVSPDTTILRINCIGADRLGSTPDALRGQRIVDLSPPEIAPRRVQIAREVVRQRRTISFIDNRDGMWLENTVSPILDDTDTVSRFAIFSLDITVPYLTRRIETLFNRLDREVLDGAPVSALTTYACEFLAEAFASPLVSFIDNAGTAMERRVCSGAWCQASSFPYVHPQLLSRALSQVNSRVQVFRASDYPGLALFPALDGNQPESVAILTIELPLGLKAMLTIASAHAGVFEHSEVFALLEHAANRFRVAFGLLADRRELSLVQQALERAHSAVIITDGEGRIVWVNDAFSRQSGYAPGEISDIQELFAPAAFQPGETAELKPEPFERAVAAGQASSGEARSLRKDGSIYTVLRSITPVFAADGETVQNLIAIQEDISRRKRDEAHIRYLAEHDSLTGLHNREYLGQMLGKLLLTNRRNPADRFALLYLDIDHFKQVNDQFGHATGDALLKGFAQRLREVVREGDQVCRIGGDEFVLILMDIRNAAEAEAVGLKLLHSLATPIDCDGHQLTAQTSIGVSLAPEDGATPDRLLRNADIAMYESKRQGRGRLCFFAGTGTSDAETSPSQEKRT